jgi:hypothetical protein
MLKGDNVMKKIMVSFLTLAIVSSFSGVVLAANYHDQNSAKAIKQIVLSEDEPAPVPVPVPAPAPAPAPVPEPAPTPEPEPK